MIRFDHVSKSYKGTPRPALDDITTEILRGEFVFVVGASGSGKSTFLRLILREEKVTRGKLHVLGQNLSSISNRKVPYFRRNVGVVFQDFRLLTNKTVFDNVAFTLRVIGKSNGYIHEAVPDVLAMVGLDGKAQRFPHELSGGEQQRVAIARAVVNKPQILLADEPTGNLDPATSAGITAVLERINASGTTVLMATHEAGLVDRMQKRVIELVDGRLVRDERHGGYGFTGAVPVLDARERAAETAPAPDGTGVVDQPEAVPVSAIPVPTAPVDPTSTTASAAAAAESDAKPARKAESARSARKDSARKGSARKDSGRKDGKRITKSAGVESASAKSAGAASAETAATSTTADSSTPAAADDAAVAGSVPSNTQTQHQQAEVQPEPEEPRGEPVPVAAAGGAASVSSEAGDETARTSSPSVTLPDAPSVDELSLAERLGLRGPGKRDHDDDANQDVGPVS
jgi:cell division transport system ATP-binding protein